jgi:tellurite resistance protein
MSIAKLLPTSPVAPDQAEILLELAFLMTAADGKLRAEEVAAFSEIAQRIAGLNVGANALASRFAVTKTSEVPSRVRALAPKVAPELRETAFKIAMGLALVDQDGSPEEDDLVTVFVQALGLDMKRAETLAEETRNAFGLE